MQPRLKFALLLGAVLATGMTAAIAAMTPQAPSGQYAGNRSFGNRIGGRFLTDFDLNHDGRITRDEFNRAEGQHFASIAHGQPINGQQFSADSMKKRHDREMEAFRRADWNGDGKLTLDEYEAPLHTKFSYADRKSSGTISCAPHSTNTNFGNGGDRNAPQRHSRSSRGLCFGNDLNQDGHVTRAEFDTASARAFAAATHGAKTMSFDQYAAIGAGHYQQVSGRIFQHMDVNNDGKLTLAEYVAPQQKQFARLDKNNDGVVTREELASAPRYGEARNNNNRGAGRYSASR